MNSDKSCSITVKYLGLVRNILDSDQEEIEVPVGQTIGGLLQTLVEKHGENLKRSIFTLQGKLRPMVVVYLNDRQIRATEALNTPLLAGGRLSVVVGMYAVAGGGNG